MTQLINGDCLSVLDTLIKSNIKVDLVLTDPPYGTTKCKWDEIIPFNEMWTRLKLIRKEDTPILLFGIEPFSSKLRVSNIKEYRYDWYWQKDKRANFLFGNKQPLKVIETISVFYKKQPDYFPQKIINPKGTSKRHLSPNPSKVSKNVKSIMGNGWKETKMDDTQNYHGKTYEPNKLLPTTLIYQAKDQRNKLHPTQKPVQLLEYFVKTYSVEDDIILDFTMGSGSTGVACKNLHRQFIGIELDKEYFNIAVDRITND